MAITISTTMADSFRKELLMGSHLFKASAGNTFKMLLLKATASGAGTYNASNTNVGTPGTSAPSTSNVGTDENGGTGYSTNGFTMTPNADPTITSNIAYVDWTGPDPNWTTATISSCGAVLYNSTGSGTIVGNFSFGGDVTSTAGTFSVVLPAPGTGAILRV